MKLLRVHTLYYRNDIGKRNSDSVNSLDNHKPVTMNVPIMTYKV